MKMSIRSNSPGKTDIGETVPVTCGMAVDQAQFAGKGNHFENLDREIERMRPWEIRDLIQNNPAIVMLMIREGEVNCRLELHARFRAGVFETSARWCIELALDRVLQLLETAGLVRLEEEKISATSLLHDVQKALGIGLIELASRRPKSVSVNPLFGALEKPPLEAEIFVLMPFEQKLSGVYTTMQTVASDLGLSIGRADKFLTSHQVIKDVWNGIGASQIILADCTGSNPNVIYEIGISHTLGKPVILLAQSTEDIPYDLHQHRYIIYSRSRGLAALSKTLQTTIRNTLGCKHASVPITWFVPGILAHAPYPLISDGYALRQQGIRAIISLHTRPDEAELKLKGFEHLQLQINDYGAATSEQFNQANHFIDVMQAQGKPVLIHCLQCGRSGGFLAAYEIRRGCTCSKALEHVRSLLPGAADYDDMVQSLITYEIYLSSHVLT